MRVECISLCITRSYLVISKVRVDPFFRDLVQFTILLPLKDLSSDHDRDLNVIWREKVQFLPSLTISNFKLLILAISTFKRKCISVNLIYCNFTVFFCIHELKTENRKCKTYAVQLSLSRTSIIEGYNECNCTPRFFKKT